MSKYVPHTILMTNFLGAQGYKLEKCVLYQDNESAIKMEKNGRNLCTGNLRHISIRYFFVKDRVDKGEFTIEYCPTECMLADFFTKPLQGALFTKLREVVMGWKHVDTLRNDSMSPIKERVGKHVSGDSARKPRKSYSEAVTNSLKVTRDEIMRHTQTYVTPRWKTRATIDSRIWIRKIAKHEKG